MLGHVGVGVGRFVGWLVVVVGVGVGKLGASCVIFCEGIYYGVTLLVDGRYIGCF